MTMMTKERLGTALKSMDGVSEVKVIEDRRLIAIVVSPRFEGQNEAVRQAQVWRHLQQQFVDEELQRVEFVVTQTPTERAA